MGKTVNPVYVQTTHRFVDDNAANNSATLLGSNGDDRSYAIGATIRIRFLVQQTDAATTDLTVTPVLYYSYNGGTYTQIGEPTDTDAPIRVKAIANITDGTATSQRIGAGSFVAGTLEDSASSWSSVTFTNGSASETEWEIALEIYSGYPGIANSDTIALQVKRSGGTDFNGGYTDTPVITVLDSNVTRTPDQGTGAFAGKVPALAQTANQWITPDQGTGVFAGAAPALTETAPPITIEIPAVDRNATYLLPGGVVRIGTPILSPSGVIIPDAQAQNFVGYSPTLGLTANTAISVGAGAATIAGQEPTVDQTANQWITPDQGTGVFAGAAPTLGYSYTITPDAGAGTFAGSAPTIGAAANVVIDIPAQSTSSTYLYPFGVVTGSNGLLLPGGVAYLPEGTNFAGYAPTVAVTNFLIRTPGKGTGTFAGAAPTVEATANIWLTPDQGAGTFAGAAPTADTTAHQWIDVEKGQGGFTGQEPTAAVTENQWAYPTPSQNALDGYAPTLDQTANHWITPDTGAGTFSGKVPTADAGDSVTRQPDAGAGIFSGLAPTLDQTANQWITLDAGAGTFAGSAPTPDVTENQWIAVGAGAAVFSGKLPTLDQTANHWITPDAGAGVFVGQSPAADAGDNKTAQPGAATAVLAGSEPTLSQTLNQWRSPATASLTASGKVPDATSTENQWIEVGSGSATFSGKAPIALSGGSKVVQPGTLAAVFGGKAPTILVTTTEAEEEEQPTYGWANLRWLDAYERRLKEREDERRQLEDAIDQEIAARLAGEEPAPPESAAPEYLADLREYVELAKAQESFQDFIRQIERQAELRRLDELALLMRIDLAIRNRLREEEQHIVHILMAD